LCSEYSFSISGWGIDDDVYFSEPQKLCTFRDEHKKREIKAMEPVKRFVKKPASSMGANKNQKASNEEPWGLPKVFMVEDLTGME
jgi:hypothetical protein